MDPKTLSLSVKGVTQYSRPCKIEKIHPKPIVSKTPSQASPLRSPSRALWAQVILAPLDSNIKVFNKGKSQGLEASIPKGGHIPPQCILGDNAL